MSLVLMSEDKRREAGINTFRAIPIIRQDTAGWQRHRGSWAGREKPAMHCKRHVQFRPNR